MEINNHVRKAMTSICGVQSDEKPKKTLFGSGNKTASRLEDLGLSGLDRARNRYSQTDMFITNNTRVFQSGDSDPVVTCDVPGMPDAKDKVTVNARTGAISGGRRMVKGPKDAQVYELMFDQKTRTIQEVRNTGNTMPNADVDKQ